MSLTIETDAPWALITGATGGLGLEFCKLLAAKGYRLVVTGRDASKLALIREEIPQAEVALAGDLTDPVCLKNLIAHLKRDGIKILESASLPLGILECIHPTIYSEQLEEGDIVVFMSDGITSAFPSATDLYAFFEKLKPLNPQSLADAILAAAKKAAGGKCPDDMTVVAARIFAPATES